MKCELKWITDNFFIPSVKNNLFMNIVKKNY